jgi:hypothetical protein
MEAAGLKPVWSVVRNCRSTRPRAVGIGGTTLHAGDLLTLDDDEGAPFAGAAETQIENPVELLTWLKALRQRGRSGQAGLPGGRVATAHHADRIVFRCRRRVAGRSSKWIDANSFE